MKLLSTCTDCGKVFAKRSDGATFPDRPEGPSIAETMVHYLARRHRETTGHTTTAIEKVDD